jgi:nucleotide-binding universal stress UspA family protein
MNARKLGVLVGVDGSTSARLAVQWAVDEASAQGSPLTVVFVLDGWPSPEVPVADEVRAVAEGTAMDALNAAVACARLAAPTLPVTSWWVGGTPAVELVKLGHDADVLVVGSHGRGEFARLVRGSVGAHLAAQVPCPVVVVRGESRRRAPVIAGVDGSWHDEAVLKWAFEYADRHRLPLQAVHASWSYDTSLEMYPGMRVAVQENAELAREAVELWAAKYPDVSTELVASSDTAAHALTQASQQARLLVVGSRGHGGLAGLLLGSVSQALVRQGHCPVAIVR